LFSEALFETFGYVVEFVGWKLGKICLGGRKCKCIVL